MGTYIYKARKSKPLAVVFKGQKIQAHRYVFLAKQCFSGASASTKRISGRINGAWAGAVPQYGVEIEKPSEEAFGWLYGNLKSITWYDCNRLGEVVGCVVRNLKNKWITIPVVQFYAMLKRVTGYEECELWQAKSIVLDQTTEDGCIIGHYIKYHGFRGIKIISPIEAELLENIVI